MRENTKENTSKTGRKLIQTCHGSPLCNRWVLRGSLLRRSQWVCKQYWAGSTSLQGVPGAQARCSTPPSRRHPGHTSAGRTIYRLGVGNHKHSLAHDTVYHVYLSRLIKPSTKSKYNNDEEALTSRILTSRDPAPSVITLPCSVHCC